MARPTRVAASATIPVLMPLWLDQPYDYLAPEGVELAPGDFVLAPIGPMQRIGVVWDGAPGDPPPKKLKSVIEKLDAAPLPEVSRRFAEWVARYTLTPLGMALKMMMSASEAFDAEAQRWGYRLAGSVPPRMTPGRARVLEAAANGLVWPKSALAEAAGVSYSVIDGLADAGALVRVELPRARMRAPLPDFAQVELGPSQARAAHSLREAVAAGAYSVSLLDGVTGSGKTEVYFEAVAEAIARGRQSLILLPEIALTGQFLARFEARFGCRPAEWHSAVSPAERGRIWRAVASGEAKAVAGARSALFLPFADLGLIVVDEEHDASYKQEDKASYQGRDMAVARGWLGKCAVVLASATPSIDSIVNVRRGRYNHIRLEERFAGAAMPNIEAIDMRIDKPERGRWLSPRLVDAVNETLARGEQALLFLNRRGYAPLTLCRKCGHRLDCPQCTAHLVEHRFRDRLACHHCGFMLPTPKTCPKCGAEDHLAPCGPGVERVAEEVAERWPEMRTAILSSDLTPTMKALREVIETVASGEARIVIGTQLVAKGHHFPRLATVGVVDGDLSLATADPRAAERTFQLLNQVTGRAGRSGTVGRGYIQTYLPEHPVMQAIVSGDREQFYEREIAARAEAGMPPFGRLAAVLVSAKTREEAQAYARAFALAAPRASRIEVLGPAEAPIAVIRGRHRFRLLAKAALEADLQAYMREWLACAPQAKGSVMAQVDIDPYSFL
ncbi:MAG: primosomal protein N' [Hyphomicrobiales bacterium]|nr:primosomal protein N' [Hyphomicrobiales bacterium]